MTTTQIRRTHRETLAHLKALKETPVTATPTDDDTCANCGKEVSPLGSMTLRADGRLEHGWDCVANQAADYLTDAHPARDDDYTPEAIDRDQADEVPTLGDVYGVLKGLTEKGVTVQSLRWVLATQFPED